MYQNVNSSWPVDGELLGKIFIIDLCVFMCISMAFSMTCTCIVRKKNKITAILIISIILKFVSVFIFQINKIHCVTVFNQVFEGCGTFWVIWSLKSCSHCSVYFYIKTGVSMERALMFLMSLKILFWLSLRNLTYMSYEVYSFRQLLDNFFSLYKSGRAETHQKRVILAECSSV